jgi:hypothetical protein
MQIVTLQITSLSFGKETQARESTCQKTVKEYADALQSGAKFPPVIVFHDALDLYYVGDGTHRVMATLETGGLTIECEVRQGGLIEAKKYACSANKTHGLKRTNADKRKAVVMYWEIVKDENPRPSTHDIADWCGVGKSLVQEVVKADSAGRNGQLVKGKDGKTYNTSNIGKNTKRTPAAPPKPDPKPEPDQEPEGEVDFEPEVEPEAAQPQQESEPEPVQEPEPEAEGPTTPSKATSAPLEDRAGNIITAESAEAFSVLNFYQEADQHVRALQKIINQIGNHPGGCEMRRFLRPIGPEGKTILKSDKLIELINDLKYTRPYSICCRCKGKANPDCKSCCGRGWWTKTTYKGANPETTGTKK